MLAENHPLSEYTKDDGFQIQEVAKVNNLRRKVDIEKLVEAFGPDEPNLIPLRDIVPMTEGRITGWKMKDHVQSALARKWPNIKPFEFHGQEVIICGGGPSLLESIPMLRDAQKRGVKIIAINRTHDFLINLPKTHGVPWIKPWAGILLEALPRAAEYQTPMRGVRYYISSQCAPETFDKFEKSEHYIWHAKSKPELEECLSLEEKRLIVPPIGSTCGLRAIVLAYMMGFTTIHVVGLDSSYKSENILNGVFGAKGVPALHAYDKPETIHDVKELVVRGFDGGDKTYWGNGNMLAQADEFQKMMDWRNEQMKRRFMDPHEVYIYGYGLIPDMAKAWGKHREWIN